MISWSSFLSQKSIVEGLQSTILTGKIPNAFLFYGPEGVGKEVMAFAFAKSLNCDQVSQTPIPCNACVDCYKFSRFSHPNLEFLFPIEASLLEGKKESIEKYNKLINKKKRNPYLRIGMEKSMGILVGQIKGVIEKLALYPSNARQVVVVISQADRLRMDAANKLLKVLEEPPRYVTFVLTTSYVERVPMTIRSRCQLVSFKSLTIKEILKGLKERNSELSNEKHFKLAASFSKGNFSNAIQFIDNDEFQKLKKMRDVSVDFLRCVLMPSRYLDMVSYIESFASVSFLNSDKIKVLSSLLLFFQDVNNLYIRKDKASIANQDISETIKKFSDSYSHVDLLEAVKKTECAIHEISRNANPLLVFYKLALSLMKIFYRQDSSTTPQAA